MKNRTNASPGLKNAHRKSQIFRTYISFYSCLVTKCHRLWQMFKWYLDFCLLPSDYGCCTERSQKLGSFYFTLALASGTYNKWSWKDFLSYTSILDENKTKKVSSQFFLYFTFTFLLCFNALILFPKQIYQDPNGHDSQRKLRLSSTGWKKNMRQHKKESNLFGYLMEVIYAEVWMT